MRYAVVERAVCLALAVGLTAYAGRLFLPSDWSSNERTLAIAVLCGAAGLIVSVLHDVFRR